MRLKFAFAALEIADVQNVNEPPIPVLTQIVAFQKTNEPPISRFRGTNCRFTKNTCASNGHFSVRNRRFQNVNAPQIRLSTSEIVEFQLCLPNNYRDYV